jgi:hypothetical protein
MHPFAGASKGFADQIWRRDIVVPASRYYNCGQQTSTEEA